MEAMKQGYISRHGCWKDRDECKRLAALGESPETMHRPASLGQEVKDLLKSSDFEEWTKEFNTRWVVQVSLDSNDNSTVIAK